MFVNGDTKTTLDATLSDGTTVVKSGSFAPNGVDADDYITYELEAGKTYNYYTAGTKWRIRSFEFTPGDISGIEDIITDSETSTGNGKIYNLMGIEVKGNLTPGIYIRDGKKFLVK